MASESATPEPGVSEQPLGSKSSNYSEESLQAEDIQNQDSDRADTSPSPSAASANDLAQSTRTAAPDDEGSSDEGSISETDDDPVESTANASSGAPPLPNEPTPADISAGAPPLPSEPTPAEADDGWDCHWDAAHQSWFFHNRITNESTWENPRVPQPSTSTGANTQLQTPPATAVPPLNEPLPAGGYNPAIHGDYDPNAWYAQNDKEADESEVSVMDPATAYAAIGSFNRFTGRWQGEDQDPERHNDEAKSRRQMNAFFDVDAAANAHDGRSLKAERSGKKPTKSELKHFKEKRKAKKEEKRRAWLRD